jgi:hypothetical protein
MVETLLGGLLGGIFRIIPEILKWMDRKDERRHELSLQDKQLEFQRLKGSQRLEEIGAESQAQWDAGALDALKGAVAGQDALTGVRWVDGFSHLMRPLITFQWVIVLYPAVIVAGYFMATAAGTPPLQALVECFGPAEKALVAGILNFWFLGRVFDRVK